MRNLTHFSKMIVSAVFMTLTAIVAFKAHAIGTPQATLSGTTLTLTWGQVSGANHYQLQYRNGGGSPGTSGGKYYNGRQVWNGVSSLNERSYRLRACFSIDFSNCGGWSAWSNAVSTVSIPSAPSYASASVSGTTLTVSWGASSGATYYKLEYRNGGGNWILSASTYSGTSTSASNLSVNQRSYRAKACNSAGCSGWSAASNAVTIPPKPSTPSHTTATVNGSSLTLSWGLSGYATYYLLQYRDNYGTWQSPGGQYSGTSKSWFNEPALKRSYRMKACNSSGCSNYSSESQQVTVLQIPAAIAVATAIDVTLSWSGITNASKYKIFVKFNNNSWVEHTETTGNSITWSNLPPGNRTYKIKACDNTGYCSDASAETASVYSLPSQVAKPSASLVGRNITLSWTEITGATGYQIEKKIGAGDWITQDSPLGLFTGNSYTWSEQSFADNIIFRMKACADGQCSSEWSVSSNDISITPFRDPDIAPAVNKSGSTITVTLAEVLGAEFYQLEIKFNDNSWVNSGDTTDLTHSWTDLPPGTRSYRYKACSQALGCSVNTSPVSQSVSLPPNDMLSPLASVTNKDVTLSWSPLVGVTHYLIEYSNDGSAWIESEVSYTGSQKSWLNQPNTINRQYRIKACSGTACSLNWSPPSQSIDVLDQPSVLAAPTAILVGDKTTLSWNLDNNASSYKIEVKYETQGWTTVLDKVNSLTYEWQGLPTGTREYRVSACNAGFGCSTASSASAAITTLPQKMSTPKASVHGNDVTLTWSKIANPNTDRVIAATYKLQYRNGTGEWFDSASTYQGEQKVWLDQPNTENRNYRMKACQENICSQDWSEASNSITVVQPTAPEAPAAPVASQNGLANTIIWSPVANAEFYNVQVQFNQNNWVDLGDFSVNTVTWRALDSGQRKYRVKACNTEFGCSEVSSESASLTTTDESIYFELLPTGDFEQINDMQAAAGVSALLDSTAPIAGIKSLKVVSNNLTGIGYEHTDFTSSGTLLSSAVLTGVVSSEQDLKITVITYYVGQPTDTNTEEVYVLSGSTAVQHFEVTSILDKSKEVEKIKVNISHQCIDCTSAEYVIDDLVFNVSQAKLLTVFSDEAGNLYFKGLPDSEGNLEYFKLERVNGIWQYVRLTLQQYEVLTNLKEEGIFNVAQEDFNGDGLNDLTVFSNNGAVRVQLLNSNSGFSLEKVKQTLFIHTDLLGSPVAETDFEGGIQ